MQTSQLKLLENWILPLRKKVKGTKFRCRTLAFALCFSRILFIFTLRLYHYIYLNQWIWLAFDIAQQTCKMTWRIEEMSMLPKGPPHTHTHTPVISVLMVGLKFLNIPELLALNAWPRIKPLTPSVWKSTLPGDDCTPLYPVLIVLLQPAALTWVKLKHTVCLQNHSCARDLVLFLNQIKKYLYLSLSNQVSKNPRLFGRFVCITVLGLLSDRNALGFLA